MHASVMKWVRAKVAEHDIASASVLECGSADVNGSVRRFFSGPYVGIDLDPDAAGVDVVASASAIPWLSDHFDVVVTTEMMEHDPEFWHTMPEMARVLKSGGLLLLTTRGIGFPYHPDVGFNDYWRFTRESIELLLRLGDFQVLEIVADPLEPGWFAVGRKP